MRKATQILITAGIAAMPAMAQATNVPSGIAGPDAEMAQNATEQATVNGLAGGAESEVPQTPPAVADPAATGVTVTPETGESGGGFPWGILGLLGLAGLIGRFRSNRSDPATPRR